MEPSTARKGTKMKVIATIDTRAANRGDEPSQKRELEVDVEGATYEAARDALFEQVPDGWLIVGGIGVPGRTIAGPAAPTL
jgi:hypothetical protein